MILFCFVCLLCSCIRRNIIHNVHFLTESLEQQLHPFIENTSTGLPTKVIIHNFNDYFCVLTNFTYGIPEHFAETNPLRYVIHNSLFFITTRPTVYKVYSCSGYIFLLTYNFVSVSHKEG